ncbi:hypothetical protein B0T17DRAFT_588610 [Bombardia bombarda]|uniref:Suppressor of anucleate metulae protein B n=1 Tax=Bombardia bombarda TaxID=252184 RepID=A0AA40C8I5_9PEZI|nr:hypothetical protein B0T17DRAFT_588610 [Bombardia bombarda]
MTTTTNPSAPAGTRIAEQSPLRHGRSLLATRTFQPGELIATFNRPILALPDGPGMRTTCNYCLRPSSSPTNPPVLRACTACHAAVYCGAACQRAHWKSGVHKAECAMFARVRANAGKDWLPTPVRAAVQVLMLLQARDRAVVVAFGPRGSLEGNVEAFRRDAAVWADFDLQGKASLVYGRLLGTNEMLGRAKEVLCKIQTNAFNRLDADTGAAGIFLDPGLAMVNHSCVPNAFVSFERRSAMLRAERQIEVGDEILISYVDYTAPKTARQEALRLYHFQCDCPRCKDDLDVYQSLALQDPTSLIRARWSLVQTLVAASTFAVEPLPSAILAASSLFQTTGGDAKLPYALSLSCLLATACEPFKLVAPFLPWRVKGVMVIAKLLSATAPLTASGKLAAVCAHKGLVGTLARSDQVSMCEAMLRLVLVWVEMGGGAEEVRREAKEMLGDIESLEGRERESELLRGWAGDLQNKEGRAFFEAVVLAPVRELAGWAVGIMDAEFGERGEGDGC